MTAALTSATGFLLHILAVEILEKWLSDQPIGMTYSPAVTLLAALTSIETGIGMTLLYHLTFPALRPRPPMFRALIVAALLLAVQGRLFRQALMDQIVGGFAWMSLMQDIVPWVIWGTMSLVLICAYDRFMRQGNFKISRRHQA